ncbi:MAG TPA: lycopene cyclase domain-containing protein [Galbitalea sp.]|nr:lycopene cyclase domain-containing protein [Galbitalea sp.]
MTYWALDAIFLGAVVLIAVATLATRRAPKWVAVLIAAGILLVLTAIFDNVMIGIGLVGYDRALISGIFIGRAPLEDFAYTVAAAVLLPSLWTLLGRKRERV